MTAFQQISDASQNLLDEEMLSQYGGAVLSPVNYDEEATVEFMHRLRIKRAGDFDFILDPQMYFPKSQRGKLRKWRYFPQDFESADRSSSKFWINVTKDVARVGMDLSAQYVASPAEVPKMYDNSYFEHLTEIGSALAERTNDRFEPMQSVIVPLRDLADLTRALKIASIVSATKCQWIYLMLDTDQQPRSELDDADQLTGVMQLIHALERAGLHVLVAYSSSDVLLWKAAGASGCATGKYFNVRRFTRSRFEDKKDGGGVVEYWFEESLLSFIRQADIVRLRREGLLSQTTLRNPLFNSVIKAIEAEEAWLKLSWLQYMRWFADVESRLASGAASAYDLVTTAIGKWRELDARKIGMVERQNTGEWLTRWKQALDDFEKWRAAGS